MVKKGWSGNVYIANTAALLASAGDAKCLTVPFSYDSGTESVYVIGSRLADDVVEGNIALTGTITRNFDNVDIVASANVSITLHEAAGLLKNGSANMSSYFLKVCPNGSAVTPCFTLNDIKFTSWNIDITQDGLISESADYIAKSINVSTK